MQKQGKNGVDCGNCQNFKTKKNLNIFKKNIANQFTVSAKRQLGWPESITPK